MTTEPGVLPKEKEDLDIMKMSPILQKTLFSIKTEIKRLNASVLEKKKAERDLNDSSSTAATSASDYGLQTKPDGLQPVDFKNMSAEEVDKVI